MYQAEPDFAQEFGADIADTAMSIGSKKKVKKKKKKKFNAEEEGVE